MKNKTKSFLKIKSLINQSEILDHFIIVERMIIQFNKIYGDQELTERLEYANALTFSNLKMTHSNGEVQYQ